MSDTFIGVPIGSIEKKKTIDSGDMLLLETREGTRTCHWGDVQNQITSGFTAQLSYPTVTLADGSTAVLQKVDGYVGGVGEVPDALKENIGKYAAKAGGYTEDVNDASVMELTFEDRSVTPEKTTFAERVIFYGKNRFNKSAITGGKRVNEVWGNIYDAQGWSISEFIYVGDLKGQKVTANYLFQVSFYTAKNEDSFISGINYGGGSNISFAVPATAEYAVFSVENPFIDSLQIEAGTTATGYEKYKAPQQGIVIEDLIIPSELSRTYDEIEVGDSTVLRTILHGEIYSDHVIYRSNIPQQNFYFAGSGNSLKGNTYYYGNVAAGLRALANCDASMTNVAVGNFALENFGKSDPANPTAGVGADCTAVGDQVMRKLKEGVGNSGFGKLCLAWGEYFTNCTAYGDTALEFNQGNSNNAFGYSAGIRAKYGSGNNLFGTFAGGTAIPSRDYYSDENYMASFSECCAFGNATLQMNLTGSRNNLFGNYGGHILTGEDNAGFGHYVLRQAKKANRNSCFGGFSGGKLADNANDNIIIGFNAANITGQKPDAKGTTVIGVGAISKRDNEIVIGKSTDTHVTICGVEFTKAQLQKLLSTL